MTRANRSGSCGLILARPRQNIEAALTKPAPSMALSHSSRALPLGRETHQRLAKVPLGSRVRLVRARRRAAPPAPGRRTAATAAAGDRRPGRPDGTFLHRASSSAAFLGTLRGGRIRRGVRAVSANLAPSTPCVNAERSPPPPWQSPAPPPPPVPSAWRRRVRRAPSPRRPRRREPRYRGGRARAPPRPGRR